MSDLTPDELKFFETGDASHLQPPEPDIGGTISPPAAAPVVVTPPPVEAPSLELARQLESDRAAQQRMEARIAALQEQITQATTPPPTAAPDPKADPLGAMMHDLSTLKNSLSKLEHDLTTSKQQTVQQQQFNEFTSNLARMRDDFAKTTPDFHDAYKHLRTARADDLRDVGVPEADIANALMQDELAVAVNAQQRGKNPAQVIYDMAKRYGYKPTAAAAAAGSANAKIELAQKGVAAAIAPAKAGTDGTLTFEGLKDASDADLSRVAQDDKLWSTLIGNRTNSIF